MKVVRVRPGAPLPPGLEGAVLVRDLRVGGAAWSKGRRCSAADLAALATGSVAARGAWAEPGGAPDAITLIVPEAGDLHEDDAARRLAAAAAGPGVVASEPAESRVDLRARHDGVLRVRTGLLERVGRLDGVSVFSAFDGSILGAGGIAASVKTGPHVVAGPVVARAERLLAAGPPLVDVLPFRPLRIAAVVRESLADDGRARFADALAARAAGLGCTLAAVTDLPADPDAVARVLDGLLRGPGRAGLLLAAGASGADPGDPLLLAIASLGGRVVSHGVPAHPGSMLLLARIRGVPLVALPTCGAYSRATAADLLIPWLVAGLPASRATVARLAHGGVLGREQRVRFPAYARSLGGDPG